MDTADVRVTVIVRAGIVVGAHELDLAALTGAVHALVLKRTGVAVVARQVRGHMLAGARLIAGVHGTQVPVVTIDQVAAGLAFALLAEVPERARIAVAAGPVLRCMGTAPQQRVAEVGRAWVVVLAVGLSRPGHALSVFTFVPVRTGVPVVARGLVRGVLAPQLFVTEVVRTRVGVRALLLGRTALALALCTEVADAAHVAVVTRVAVGRVHAADRVFTLVVRAVVVVVAHHESGTRPALRVLAVVAYGARVLVAARTVVGLMGAPDGRVAGIVGTVVVVVAGVRQQSLALPADTHVTHGTEVIVVARDIVRGGKCLVGHGDHARLALVVGIEVAVGIAGAVDQALVLSQGVLAPTGPVADVVRARVPVGAGVLDTLAHPELALVGMGARVVVVTHVPVLAWRRHVQVRLPLVGLSLVRGVGRRQGVAWPTVSRPGVYCPGIGFYRVRRAAHVLVRRGQGAISTTEAQHTAQDHERKNVSSILFHGSCSLRHPITQ